MSGNDGKSSGSGGQDRAPENSDSTGIGPPPPGSTTEVTGEGKGITHGAQVKPDKADPSSGPLAE